MKSVYYYRDRQGNNHFSTGVVRDDTRAEQYIRMLQHTRRTVIPLCLDDPKDRETILELFMEESER